MSIYRSFKQKITPKVAVLGLLGTICLPLAGGAQALTTLNFDNEFDSTGASLGVLTYGGTGGPLAAENIRVDQVFASGAPTNNGSSGCDSCILSFETGNLLGVDGSAIPGTTLWAFDGGTFSVDGTHQGSGATGNLLTGDFFSPVILSITGQDFSFTVATGTDQKNDAMEAHYGLAGDTSWIAALTIIGNSGDFAGARAPFTLDVHDSDLVNREVPLPAAAWLFGSGLIGLAGIARRKRATA